MKTTLAALALALTPALALAQAAPAPRPPPVCKPAEPVVPAPVPLGGTPGMAGDFSRPYTVAAIPGVVAAGATWTKVWQQGGNSADGIVPDKSGAILLAQEDYDGALRVDAAGKVSQAVAGSYGLSSLSMDRAGNLWGVSRTERPGSAKPHKDQVINAVSQLTPTRKVVADKWAGGGTLTVRPNDLIADSRGGAFFTGNCVYYAAPSGVTVAAEDIRPNGIALSPDDKVLYVTNGPEIVAFDVTGTGTLGNRRSFARMPATDSGDGLAVDAEGRVYVTTVAAAVPGVHVFDRTGAHLGLIPTPRPVISAAFGGPDKKTLYVVGSGADDAAGKIIREGVQQTSATLYRIPVLTAGVQGRAK